MSQTIRLEVIGIALVLLEIIPFEKPKFYVKKLIFNSYLILLCIFASKSNPILKTD